MCEWLWPSHLMARGSQPFLSELKFIFLWFLSWQSFNQQIYQARNGYTAVEKMDYYSKHSTLVGGSRGYCSRA